MKLAKRIGFKLIVVLCVITTFFSFVASTPVHASKVSTTDYYYSGTQKGSYTVGKSFIEKIVKSLSELLDYILGFRILFYKMIFVGWTALAERALTWVVKSISGIEGDITDTSSTEMYGTDDWITLDAIFFNRVPILNVNVFDFSFVDGDALGKENSELGSGESSIPADNPNDEDNKSVIILFKELVAGWYYSLRLIAIMIMLILLIFIGINLAIKSVATDKALYKKVLVDWLVGMILVFTIHYIMLFVINFNEVLVEAISKLRLGAENLEVYEYGLEERAEKITNEEMEYTLYDEVKTRAYDAKLTVGLTGALMYAVLVYYAWKFTFIYLKRYLTVAVLVMMAPIVSVTYAYNKLKTGKAVAFSNWLKEFVFIVLLQSIHALMYVIFLQQALILSLSSVSGFILAFVMLNFMCKAEGIFRKIFNITGSLTQDVAAGAGIRASINALKTGVAAMPAARFAKSYTKSVARIATKPIRAGGSAAFGKYMAKRATKLDAQAKEEGYEDYEDKRVKLKKKGLLNQKIGLDILDMKQGKIDSMEKISELEQELTTLKIGDKVQDKNGNSVEVTQEYLESRRKTLENYKNILQMINSEKDFYTNELKNSRKVSTYFKGKWQDIMAPDQYVEKLLDEEEVTEIDENGNVLKRTKYKPVLDENGNQVYKAISTEREYGKFGKKVDGVAYKMAQNLKLNNLIDVSDEEKEKLQELANLSKYVLGGFAGIMVGIPLIVTEPAAGLVALSTGISNRNKLFDAKRRNRARTLSHYKMDMTGKYTFVGFDGKSEETIAEGVKKIARENYKEINNDRIIKEENNHRRIVKKHPKLVKRLANTATDVGIVTATTMGMAAGAPAIVTGIGSAAIAARFTGKVLDRSGAWGAWQDLTRASNKAMTKSYEDEFKKAGGKKLTPEQYLDHMADYYFKINEQENAARAIAKTQAVQDGYIAVTASMSKQIEEKTERELDRDAGYEEEIKVEYTLDGKKKIAGDSERKLIEDVLVENAQKCGIMDVSDFNVDKGMTQIEKDIQRKLILQGVLEKDEKVSDIIVNLEKQVKDVQAELKSSGRSRLVVEEKMAGDAVISIMQEKSITDPTQVSPEEAFDRYNQMYQSMSIEASQSKQKTTNVIEQLKDKKGEISTLEETSSVNKDKILVMIRSRQQDFATQRPSTISIEEKKKRAKAAAIDQLNKSMLAASEAVHTEETETETNTSMSTIEPGTTVVGVSADDIIKMINLTTEMEKSKKIRDYAYVNGSDKQKTTLYLEMRAESDGSRRVTSDGSKSVVAKEKMYKRKQQVEKFANMDTQEFLGALQQIQRI